MALDFTSPGGQAANAIQAFLLQRALQQRQAQLDAAAQQQKATENTRADAELGLRQEAQSRLLKQEQEQADAQKLAQRTAAAKIAVEGSPTGQNLAPAIVQQIQGTPYESRLQSGTTLPAKFGDPMNPQESGSESFTQLAKTPQQQLLESYLANPNTPDNVKQFIQAQQASGDNSLPAELFKPTESTTEPIIRVSRSGVTSTIGNAPKGAHIVNEPAPPANPSAGIIGVQTVGPNGEPVTKYMSKEDALKGGSFAKPQGQTVQNRIESAKAVQQTGNDIITKLSDPAYASKVGPVLGRYHNLQDFIGNPPPEYADLAGNIESYALANMGVHGMRSAQGAEMIKRMLDQKHTPEALIAAVKGLNNFSQHFIENTGGMPPQANTTASKEYDYVPGKGLVPR